jgi:ubiquinone/menaquinone biosynthesis C-methylase UbiE
MQPAQSDESAPWHPAAKRLETKAEYALGDLLRFDDSDFIDVAYTTLLGRSPDAAGRQGYLTALRGGVTSKIEILGLIRFSDEGQKCGVHVDGLLLPYKLHQWRHRKFVGPLLGLFMGLARLPRLALRLQSMEARAAEENHQLGAALNRLAAEVRGHLASLSAVGEEFAAFERALGAIPQAGPVGNHVVTAPGGQNFLVGAVRGGPAIDPVEFRNAAVNLVEGVRTPQYGSISESFTSQSQQTAFAIRRMLDAHAQEQAEMVRLRESIAKMDERWRQLQTQQSAFAERSALSELAMTVEGVRQTIESSAPHFENHIKAIKEVLSVKADGVQLTALQSMFDDLRHSLKDRHELADRAVDLLQQNFLASRRELLHLEQRVERVTNFQTARHGGNPAATAASADTGAKRLDSFYMALEDQFRGSRELISRRCEAYIPVVRRAVECTRGGIVLDIGCGRGEWLHVLREQGVDAYGIDLNEMMILECRARGLDARETEAIEHLRGLADASVAAVTGMHIIEHIPFPSVVTLFDEVRRVLKPGGVVVFETPNPENLDVGACGFYMDPTHLHPLPPLLIEFTALARGFNEVEIRRLTDHRPVPIPPDDGNARSSASDSLQWLLDRARERLSVAPDYAVIAWKEFR